MKIQIRKGLFETNSSSAHTLVYSKNSHIDSTKYSGKQLQGDMRHYGRWYELLDSPDEKFSYIMTLIQVSREIFDKYMPIIDSTLKKAGIEYSINTEEQLRKEVEAGIFNAKHILTHAEWYCREILHKPYDQDKFIEFNDRKWEEFRKKYNINRMSNKEYKRKVPNMVWIEEYLIHNFKGTPAQRQQLHDMLDKEDTLWAKFEYIGIDHQSLENYLNRTGDDFIPELAEILSTPDKLLDFLFSDDSFIIVDYDENSEWWIDFKNVFTAHKVPYPKGISKELIDLSVERENWYKTYRGDKDFPEEKEEEIRSLQENQYYFFPDGVQILQ